MYLLDVSIRYLKYFCVLLVFFVLFVYAVSFIAMLQSPSLMVLFIYIYLGVLPEDWSSLWVWVHKRVVANKLHQVPWEWKHVTVVVIHTGGHIFPLSKYNYFYRINDSCYVILFPMDILERMLLNAELNLVWTLVISCQRLFFTFVSSDRSSSVYPGLL